MYLAPLVFISLLKLEIISQHMATIRFGEFVFLKVSRLRVIDMTVMFKLIIAKQIPKTTGWDSTEPGQIILSLKIVYGILSSIGAWATPPPPNYFIAKKEYMDHRFYSYNKVYLINTTDRPCQYQVIFYVITAGRTVYEKYTYGHANFRGVEHMLRNTVGSRVTCS